VKHKAAYLHCGKRLRRSLENEINEVLSVVGLIEWKETFRIAAQDSTPTHQTAYNKAFEIEFQKLGWEIKPRLSDKPRLIGDFRKNLVFVEVQFGNSATLYRDFYKFQYGLQNGLLSLSVLIVPVEPKRFFPTRPRSVSNMAEYDLALRYFTVLPIAVPTMIIGLVPDPQ
jgi:hypothetical protein|tara:strand:- start:54 stop:563 length:510 start_codon:yes stop_codon:yes gene_type:complete